MTSCNGPINLFILYFVCFRREGELLSRQKDVKKISELIYLELTVRMFLKLYSSRIPHFRNFIGRMSTSFGRSDFWDRFESFEWTAELVDGI